ncbi:MAG: NAD-dependent epimerase/dehydratase family protein [Deltaproteobacteria bacterium]|nr:MAG: NAD-dependent epimerase/dehydratase family protein [Deltaproteobacteria bacterium]
MTAPARIAVTGAAGSLGRLLVDRLAREPQVEAVVAIDRVPAVYPSSKVRAVVCDVRDPAIAGALRGCDAVVHLAFIVERAPRDEALVEAVNVGGTRNVADAAIAAGAGQLVYASSIAAYGFHPDNAAGPLTEDAPCRGNDDFYYARTKAACERLLDDLEARHPAVAIARLRPSIFLGPRGRRSLDRFRRRLFAYPARAEPVPVHVTHEDDVVDAFWLALCRRARGAYNIATDEPLPVRDWPRHMGKWPVPLPPGVTGAADVAYRLHLTDINPVWLRAGSRYPIVVSTAKARRELRWRPRYDTTGQVLRALAGAPAAAASPGTRLLFGAASAVSAVRGGVPVDARGEAEMRGMRGVANLVLTGDRPSEWRIEIDGGRVAVRPGIHPEADATIAIAESDFTRMLAGQLDYAKAAMTGRVRVRGDSGYNFLVGGIVGAFRRARRGGPAARAFVNLVLRANGAAEARLGG